jgi:hypothetical protein
MTVVAEVFSTSLLMNSSSNRHVAGRRGRVKRCSDTRLAIGWRVLTKVTHAPGPWCCLFSTTHNVRLQAFKLFVVVKRSY